MERLTFVENYVPYVSYLGARIYYVFEGLASLFFFLTFFPENLLYPFLTFVIPLNKFDNCYLSQIILPMLTVPSVSPGSIY